jgi:sugar lactone lactonase YvrE
VVLSMVALAAIIGLTIEVVYLRDNFQMRMNSLFKFYFQIWILWALAAGYAFWRVMYAAFGTSSQPVDRRDRYAAPMPGTSTGMRTLTGVWAAVFALLVLSGLMYSWYAVQARQVASFQARQAEIPNTTIGLDGTTWMSRPNVANGQLASDLAVADWLKQNATGKDVVLEAGSAEYDWTGRVSSFSGVPTLIASDNSHEALWRTNQPDARQQVSQRRSVVNSIYQGVDPAGGPLTADRLLTLLKQYNVDYVVVGPIERGIRENSANARPEEQVTPYGESLFKYALTVAFNGGATQLYKVGEAIAGNGAVPTTPVAGQTPGATTGPDLSTPPVGLFDATGAGANRGQFNLPRGITQDAQGNFYVVDTQNERIEKFDKDGKWLSMFGSKGNDDGQFNPYSDDAVGTGPGGVAVDTAGNIYVADTWNHRIQKFDKDGKFVTKWGSFINLADNAVTDPNQQSMFFGPRGIAIGPDGNVYVTDTGNKRIATFTPDGKFVSEISSGVNADKTAHVYRYDKEGEMNEPIGLAVDKGGNIFVADVNNRRIQKFDPQGKFAAQWPIPAGLWDPGPYLEPFLAVDTDGNVYATAPTGKAVLKFSPTGQLLGQKNGNGKAILQLPTGITVGQDGTVYVVDTNGSSVVNLGKIP